MPQALRPSSSYSISHVTILGQLSFPLSCLLLGPPEITPHGGPLALDLLADSIISIRRPVNEATRRGGDVLSDEQLAHQLSEGLDQQNTPALPAGVFPNQTRNSVEGSPWRNAGLDSSWLHTWPGQGVDGAGPSTGMRPVGLGRVQMMMRHLASVGETYAQTALEDAAWSLWPMNPSQAVASGSHVPPATVGRSAANTGGLHMRTLSHSAHDNITNILAMAETVREVLPHIPDELILQDLQRTNSATVTVNNLLQM